MSEQDRQPTEQDDANRLRTDMELCEQLEEARRLLEQLVEVEPYDSEFNTCLYCGVEAAIELQSRDNPIRKDHTQHLSDCAWSKTRAFLGEES